MRNTRIIGGYLVALIMASIACADVWDQLAAYEYGDQANPAEEVRRMLQDGPPQSHSEIEAGLIAVITSAQATPTGKALACRFLQQIGTPRCIPAVAALLHNSTLSDDARGVLERLQCNAADQALRQALTDAPDQAKIGILGSLGERRDKQAVKPIAVLTGSTNPTVAKAAIHALGKIGGESAAEQLTRLKPDRALVSVQMQAMVDCAGSLSGSDQIALCERVLAGPDIACRVAALHILAIAHPAMASPQIVQALQETDKKLHEGALDIVAHTQGHTLTQDMLGLLGTTPAQQKAALITALGTRGDSAALKGIMPYLKTEDNAVKEAAITAVSKLGDTEVVKPLLETAQSPARRDQVVQAMTAMPDHSIDRALINSLSDPTLRLTAMEVLVTRGYSAAVTELLKLASHHDSDVRQQAWSSLGVLGTEEHMNVIMAVILMIDNIGDLSHAEAAIRKIFARARDKGACFQVAAGHYDQATDTIKGAILGMGAWAGDDDALELERKALASGQSELSATALRALARWPNALAADDLLKQAQDASQAVDRLIALRGYIRIAGLETVKLPNAERMKMLKTATALAQRDDERKQIINSLEQVTTLEALQILEKHLDNPRLQAEAEVATSNLIWKIRRAHPEEVTPIAERLMQSKNRRVTEKARRTLNDVAKN